MRLKREVAKMNAAVEQLSQGLQVRHTAQITLFNTFSRAILISPTKTLSMTRFSPQAVEDALERGEPTKVSRLELQRRREMTLTISQRLECASTSRCLHSPSSLRVCRYMSGLVNQPPPEEKRRPLPRASHDDLGIRCPLQPPLQPKATWLEA